MPTQTIERKRALIWRVTVTVLLVIGGLFLLGVHWHTVSRSITAISDANASWLALAALLMASTFFIAAGTYSVLALHRLHYAQTLLVELASAFVNRLLPAGLGGLGLNGVYLFHNKHSPAEATAVVSANNLLGMCEHVLLLLLVLIIQPSVVRTLFSRHRITVLSGWVVLAAVILCLVVFMLPAVRRKLLTFARNLAVSVRRLHPTKLIGAILLSVLLTTAYTLILLCTARAVGVDLKVLQLFIIFSFGVFASTAVPTPGGLVGTEAALFAGFVAYGASDTSAGATVLLFRLITYWLPLIPGACALFIVRTRKLL